MAVYPTQPRANSGAKKKRRVKETILLSLPNPKVYLVEWTDAGVNSCHAAGLDPLCSTSASDPIEAYVANVNAIHAADAVIAPASLVYDTDDAYGLGFQIGYAIAHGKPVVLWSASWSVTNFMVTAGVAVLGSFDLAVKVVAGMFPRDGKSPLGGEREGGE